MSVYTTDMICMSKAAIEAARESQWQRFLYRKWLRKQAENAIEKERK